MSTNCGEFGAEGVRGRKKRSLGNCDQQTWDVVRPPLDRLEYPIHVIPENFQLSTHQVNSLLSRTLSLPPQLRCE